MTDKLSKHQSWTRKSTPFKLVVLILLAVGIALLVAATPALAQQSPKASGFNLQEMLRRALMWINSLGSVGAIAYIALYIIATVAFLPGSIVTLGAGVVYGVGLGSIYVFDVGCGCCLWCRVGFNLRLHRRLLGCNSGIPNWSLFSPKLGL